MITLNAQTTTSRFKVQQFKNSNGVHTSLLVKDDDDKPYCSFEAFFRDETELDELIASLTLAKEGYGK